MSRKIKIESKTDNQYIKAICYYPNDKAQRDSIMKIESIDIENVGGISKLTLDNLDPHLNIICGENGIGKTNILDSIASVFSVFDTYSTNVKFGSDNGLISLTVDGYGYQKKIDRKYIDINQSAIGRQDPQDFELLYLKVNRVFKYRKEDSIKSDPERKDRSYYNANGLSDSDIKQWLISRYLHSGHPENLELFEILNFELAKKCFSILDEQYQFIKSTKQNEILIKTPTGPIYLELLSSGFKSTLFILLGIIKEIEYRFQENHLAAENFEGVILIDEVELHLHPEWQGRICSILTEVFPRAQFFITTHSPHVVQSAEVSQVIALSGNDGYLEKRTIEIAPHGFKGWTIEEILTDVMGMTDTRTKWFRDNVELFEKALDEDNFINAKNIFDELESKLHPNNRDLALFRFQLDMLEGRTK